MKREQLVEEIKYIKEVITSSIYYTNLSGIAAIVSGCAALFGCVLSYLILKNDHNLSTQITYTSYELALVWLMVFFASILAHVYFVGRKAKQTGKPAWSRLARLLLYALSPPLLIGAFLTLFFMFHNQMVIIPSLWMITYGLGVWSAGLFSIKEPRWLGASFMATGIISLFFFRDQSLIMLAISFGGYHILYGLRLFFKYGG